MNPKPAAFSLRTRREQARSYQDQLESIRLDVDQRDESRSQLVNVAANAEIYILNRTTRSCQIGKERSSY